jgi:hypothetical protein
LFLLSGCEVFSSCGNRLIHEDKSPDGTMVAALFERNCGATTPYSYHVSIRRKDDRFDPENMDARVFSVRKHRQIDVSWRNHKQLVVKRAVSANDIALERKVWNGIFIDYEPLH